MPTVTAKAVLDKLRPDGTCALLVRLTYLRRRKYLPTSLYLRPAHLNPRATPEKANWVRPAYGPDYEQANQLLAALFQRIRIATARLLAEGQPFTVDTLRDAIARPRGGPSAEGNAAEESFSHYVERQLARFARAGQTANVRNHTSVLTHLRRFLGRNAAQPIHFHELTSDRLADFEAYLLTYERRRHSSTPAARRNTATDYLRRLHQHLTGYITHHKLPSEADPLRGHRLTTAPTNPVRLAEGELHHFLTAPLPADLYPTPRGQRTLAAARTLYLAAYYLHGIRAGDILAARVGQVETTPLATGGHEHRFFFTSDKKDKAKSVRIEPELLAALTQYLSDKSPDYFIFPFLPARLRHLSPADLQPHVKSRISYVDDLLRQLATHLGIARRITLHTARHTFAEMLYRETGDLRQVQHALGHDDLLTTQRYVASFDQSVADSANVVYQRRRERLAKAQAQAEAETGTSLAQIPDTPESLPAAHPPLDAAN